MDRKLKERIIGAAVLVALAVVVVPVFLDGPPAEGEMYSERVPLPGQDEQKSQTVVLERNRSEPVPAQASPGTPQATATADIGTPAPGVRDAIAPDPDDAPPEELDADAGPAAVTPPVDVAVRTPPVEATSTTGMFAVQLGSFSSKENAEKLAAELRRQGFAAFLSQLDTSAAQLHRVRIGPQKDRQAAEEMAARLAKAGHEGQVVPHP